MDHDPYKAAIAREHPQLVLEARSRLNWKAFGGRPKRYSGSKVLCGPLNDLPEMLEAPMQGSRACHQDFRQPGRYLTATVTETNELSNQTGLFNSNLPQAARPHHTVGVGVERTAVILATAAEDAAARKAGDRNGPITCL